MIIANKIFEWVAQITFLFALLLSLTYRKRKELFPIQLYIILFLTISLLNVILSAFNTYQYKNIESASMNIFSLIEISLIYYFLLDRITGDKSRLLIKIFWFLYISICGLFWISNKESFFLFAPDLFGIESILIIIPCLIHIYEILKSNLTINLNHDPNFIVTCGILFYHSILIPTFFSWYILYYLSPGFEKILIMTNLICSIFLIISFMKAYLCPIPDQQQ
jgi:hypothetical protein